MASLPLLLKANSRNILWGPLLPRRGTREIIQHKAGRCAMDHLGATLPSVCPSLLGLWGAEKSSRTTRSSASCLRQKREGGCLLRRQQRRSLWSQRGLWSKGALSRSGLSSCCGKLTWLRPPPPPPPHLPPLCRLILRLPLFLPPSSSPLLFSILEFLECLPSFVPGDLSPPLEGCKTYKQTKKQKHILLRAIS